MPLVTAIKRSAKAQRVLFQVSIDGEYSFTLGDLDLSMSGLRVGHELSAEQIAEYQGRGATAKAQALAVRFIGVRMRSTREVREYLLRKETPPAICERVIERLEAQRLLDDEAFARAWVAERRLLRPRSQSVLVQELAQKGIARAVVALVLSDEPEDAELNTLRALVERKRRLPAYAQNDKLAQFLMRKGFRWEHIKQVLGEGPGGD